MTVKELLSVPDPDADKFSHLVERPRRAVRVPERFGVTAEPAVTASRQAKVDTRSVPVTKPTTSAAATSSEQSSPQKAASRKRACSPTPSNKDIQEALTIQATEDNLSSQSSGNGSLNCSQMVTRNKKSRLEETAKATVHAAEADTHLQQSNTATTMEDAEMQPVATNTSNVILPVAVSKDQNHKAQSLGTLVSNEFLTKVLKAQKAGEIRNSYDPNVIRLVDGYFMVPAKCAA